MIFKNGVILYGGTGSPGGVSTPTPVSIASARTERDMNVYISTTGNDTTGNGTQASPFATFGKAFDIIPYEIVHKINIRVAAGTYNSFPRTVRHEINSDGQLVIEGLGDLIQVAGPFTLTGATELVAGGESLGWDITVSGAGWGADDYTGKFIKYTNGDTMIDRCIPIFSNTTDTIRHLQTMTYSPDVPKAGSTFTIVEPTVKINIADDNTVFDIRSNGVDRTGAVIMANLEFTNTASDQTAFLFTNTGRFNMGVVVFRNSSQYTFTIGIYGGGINDTTFTILDRTQLVNQQLIVSRAMYEIYYITWSGMVVENTYGDSLKNWAINIGNNVNNSYSGNAVIANATTQGYTEFRCQGGGSLHYSLCGHLEVDHQSTVNLTNNIIVESTYANAIRVDDSSKLEITSNLINKATVGVNIEDACTVQFDNVVITAANVSSYGVRIGKGSKVVCTGTNALDGTATGCYFTQTSAAQAFPSAPGMITDSLGSVLIT